MRELLLGVVFFFFFFCCFCGVSAVIRVCVSRTVTCCSMEFSSFLFFFCFCVHMMKQICRQFDKQTNETNRMACLIIRWV